MNTFTVNIKNHLAHKRWTLVVKCQTELRARQMAYRWLGHGCDLAPGDYEVTVRKSDARLDDSKRVRAEREAANIEHFDTHCICDCPDNQDRHVLAECPNRTPLEVKP